MSWTAAKIRKLRLCLGWSRNDLARRLNCEVVDVEKWECEQDHPSFEQGRFLDLIERQKELVQQSIAKSPQVESFLDDSQQEQVDVSDIEH